VTVTTAPAPAGADGAPAAVASTAPPSSSLGVYKWVAFGLGAAGLGVGAYGIVKNKDGVADFDNHGCGVDAKGQAVDANGVPSDSCAATKSSYETGTILAVTGLVAGAVLIGAGLALWLTEPTTGATTTALSCAPALGARLEPGLGCAVRF
jgi:hypothetical protein